MRLSCCCARAGQEAADEIFTPDKKFYKGKGDPSGGKRPKQVSAGGGVGGETRTPLLAAGIPGPLRNSFQRACFCCHLAYDPSGHTGAQLQEATAAAAQEGRTAQAQGLVLKQSASWRRNGGSALQRECTAPAPCAAWTASW